MFAVVRSARRFVLVARFPPSVLLLGGDIITCLASIRSLPGLTFIRFGGSGSSRRRRSRTSRCDVVAFPFLGGVLIAYYYYILRNDNKAKER